MLWFPALFLIAWHGLEINTARGFTNRSIDVVWPKPYLALANPVALGAAYYLIPAVLGRTIDKYYLAIFGFGALLHLLHGRLCIILKVGQFYVVPAIGTVMSIAMVFPIAVASTNFHATAFLDIGKVWDSLPLRFVILEPFHIPSQVISALCFPYLQLQITQFTIINEFHFNQRVWFLQYDYLWCCVFCIAQDYRPRDSNFSKIFPFLDLHIWRALLSWLI